MINYYFIFENGRIFNVTKGDYNTTSVIRGNVH